MLFYELAGNPTKQICFENDDFTDQDVLSNFEDSENYTVERIYPKTGSWNTSPIYILRKKDGKRVFTLEWVEHGTFLQQDETEAE